MALREVTGNVGLHGAGASFVSAPGQMLHPMSGKSQHVGTAAVERLRKNFAAMKQELIRDGVNRIRAEFGAYMYYSWWQERGTHNKDGSWKLRPRPHIVPAVEKHYSDILKAQTQTMIMLSQAGVNGQKMNAQQEIINSWIRILNGPVAQSARGWARALDVFEFGMHIRSIHGYASTSGGLLGPSSGALGKMRSRRGALGLRKRALAARDKEFTKFKTTRDAMNIKARETKKFERSVERMQRRSQKLASQHAKKQLKTIERSRKRIKAHTVKATGTKKGKQ